ncbi:hypothetical protein PQX77_005004 [Marasmius sp. AFHP31]|nr:hypothetical protein PQX77_005004 [Marasmius sp. AFHP31]
MLSDSDSVPDSCDEAEDKPVTYKELCKSQRKIRDSLSQIRRTQIHSWNILNKISDTVGKMRKAQEEDSAAIQRVLDAVSNTAEVSAHGHYHGNHPSMTSKNESQNKLFSGYPTVPRGYYTPSPLPSPPRYHKTKVNLSSPPRHIHEFGINTTDANLYALQAIKRMERGLEKLFSDSLRMPLLRSTSLPSLRGASPTTSERQDVDHLGRNINDLDEQENGGESSLTDQMDLDIPIEPRAESPTDEPHNDGDIFLEHSNPNNPRTLPRTLNEIPHPTTSRRSSGSDSSRSSDSSDSSSVHQTRPPSPHNPYSAPNEFNESARDIREALEQLRTEPQHPLPDPDIENDPRAPVPEPDSCIETIRIAQEFTKLIREATLDDGHCPPEVVERLRKPIKRPVDISDPSVRLAIDTYLATSNASNETYTLFHEAYLQKHRNEPFLSHKEVKSLVEEITGVVSVWYDMCINSCIGYTGPFKDLEDCWKCSEGRYDPAELERSGKHIPRLQFNIILLGTQIAARFRSAQTADALRYRAAKMEKVQEALENAGEGLESVFTWDDHACGEDFREMVERLRLTEDDQIFTLTMDSFQMFKNKKSDTWIAMLISEDYAPDSRVRKPNLFPAFTVPGPNKIKHADSFLFPLLHHIAALQKENNGRGFLNWSAAKSSEIYTRPVIAFATADRVGLAEVDGRVGHHGALGCRSDCPMKGRHKPDSGHYYSAHLCTNGIIEGCMHEDFDFNSIQERPSFDRYQERVDKVSRSTNQTQYAANRRDTGISKPCILSGLPIRLPPPLCFVPDMMHLLLNLCQLHLSIYRSTIECARTDDKRTWAWATLVGDVWKDHGLAIENATRFFPSFFHRPPRNPAEKLSSGFKVTEYILYVLCLGPGHFRSILPSLYYKHFCRLVYGLRILNRRSISGKDLASAHESLIKYVIDFEELFYQRRIDRLHFCCPCIHTLIHLCPECIRAGPCVYHMQYCLERWIGDVVSQVAQFSTPWANLSARTERQAQVNALVNMCPELDRQAREKSRLPRYAEAVGHSGYVLLRKRDRRFITLTGRTAELIFEKIRGNKICRWGRLRLPSQHVARSVYTESRLTRKHLRVTRNIKFIYDRTGEIEYGEVQYYFQHEIGASTLEDVYALVSVYSRPNEQLLEESSNVLWACQHTGEDGLRVINVKTIISVVSMQPLPVQTDLEGEWWFVVEKPGIEGLDLGSIQEDE